MNDEMPNCFREKLDRFINNPSKMGDFLDLKRPIPGRTENELDERATALMDALNPFKARTKNE